MVMSYRPSIMLNNDNSELCIAYFKCFKWVIKQLKYLLAVQVPDKQKILHSVKSYMKLLPF